MHVLVYVDDLLVFSTDSSLSSQFVASLSDQFPVKDLGPAHFFLGVEISRDKNGFQLSQSKHIRDLIARARMSFSRPISTPMALDYDASATSEPVSNPTFYRSIIGGLQYLNFTRPDISFTVNKVCQNMHNPCVHHWQAVKRILRYLNATTTLKFSISSVLDDQLSTFSDAD